MHAHRLIIGIFVIAVIALVCSFISNYIKTRDGKGDFAALYKASAHARQVGSFNDAESLGYYPPSGRPILMVFTVLPLRVGAAVWWGLAVGLHLLCLYLLVWHLLPGRAADPWALAAVIYLAMLPWLVSDLAGGNISPLILASLVISYFLYRRNRCWSSALFLAVGVAVKFLPVFLIFFYAVKRRWKMAVLASAATLVVGILPGVLLVGPRDFAAGWKTWSQEALGRRTGKYMILEGPGISFINQSLPNVLLHTLCPVSAGHHDKPMYVNMASLSRPAIFKIWLAIVAVTGLAWFALVWPRKGDPPEVELAHFALVCLPMLWFSPHVMSYYLTILMPAVALLLWAISEKATVSRSFLALLVLYLLCLAAVASPQARAYGNYLLAILILAVPPALAARNLRRNLSNSRVQPGDLPATCVTD